MDLKAQTFQLECIIPELHMRFDYEISGRILLLPIRGAGPGSIIIGKIIDEYT